MYAVLKTGGKQYKVTRNDVIIVEKLQGEAGNVVHIDDILMLGDGESATVGRPLIEGARVTAQILEQARGVKIIVFKKKRRKNYRRTQGHRQAQTVLRITDIVQSVDTEDMIAIAAPASSVAAVDAGIPQPSALPEAGATAVAAVLADEGEK